MKHCIKCNAELTDKSKYCNECGKNQLTDEYDNQDSYDEQDDNYTREPVYTAKPEYRENSDYEDANNFRPKRKHSPILIICLIVIVGVVALGLMSNNKDKSDDLKYQDIPASTKSVTPEAIKTEPAKTAKSGIVGKLHEKVIVPDIRYGTYEITINSITLTTERNKYSKVKAAEVYKINYTYKLLSSGTSTHGLYVSSFASFDSTGESGEGYPGGTGDYPKSLTIIGTKCSADTFVAVKNKSSFINLVLEYNVTNDSGHMTFKIPTK
ncbi:zinc ribbon domain-containing protein [Clostridium estertheticum]|uniref:zinc ribbon domain-containing protein n=1 Tax=Clostridium estertheticum TaxID=238834 RepID=UPI001CF396C6|nr:zinc ribbon domain-containing protein [Clostridium estertheticum]MCB2353787.1 zinc ribbon domain-containing protein [Clostridium estertheticum]WAG40513.1 zinc ribbon domain-containing protein [Clostridium estertheticum]